MAGTGATPKCDDLIKPQSCFFHVTNPDLRKYVKNLKYQMKYQVLLLATRPWSLLFRIRNNEEGKRLSGVNVSFYGRRRPFECKPLK